MFSPDWREGPVSIQTTGGVMTISSHILGDFAAHEMLGLSHGAYSVTHLPTGLRLPFGEYSSLDRARHAVELLAREFNSAPQWAGFDADMRRAVGEKIKAALKANDLSADIVTPLAKTKGSWLTVALNGYAPEATP